MARYEETPPRIEHVEIASGRRRPWAGMRRARPSGLFGDYVVLVTPDGASYAYSYTRTMRDLYLVTFTDQVAIGKKEVVCRLLRSS